MLCLRHSMPVRSGNAAGKNVIMIAQVAVSEEHPGMSAGKVQLNNGTTLNHSQIGESGDHILMLHGWGQSLQSLYPLGKLIHAKLGGRIHLLDLPGFGESSAPPAEGWDTAQYADLVLEYMDKQGIDKADIIGHSFGGRLAIRIAGNHPDRAGNIILIGAAGLPRNLTLQKKLRRSYIRGLRNAIGILPGSLQDKAKGWHSDKYGSRDYKNAGQLKATFVKSVTEDLTPECTRISAPTLLLWGENDTEVPLEIAHRFNELIRNSSLIVLPRKGHFPFAESPDLCAYHITGWLAEQSTQKV